MKIKEVCVETGLSRKTIRLYEEKGLISPRRERVNGRDFREYSREDVEALKTIALLRKAWFTMDEIRMMQEDPQTIKSIFPQYRQWLRQQKRDLEQLLSVAEQVDAETVDSIDALKAAMSLAADSMSLPKADIKPRFSYLDEMEQRPSLIPRADPTDRVMGGSKVQRQAAVALSRDKMDNALIKVNLLNETTHMMKNRESGPVQGEAEKLPLWLRLIGGLLTVVLVVAALILIRDFLTFRINARSLLFFLVAFLLRGSLFYWQHLREQEAWLDRMGVERKKRRLPNEKALKYIILGVLAAAVLILGIRWIAVSMKNSTELDYRVTVVTPLEADSRSVAVLQGAIGYLVGDVNGDGVVKIELNYVLPEKYDPKDQELVILRLEDMDAFYYEDKLMELPEDMASSKSSVLADITQQNFWSNTNLEGTRYYCGVPRILDETQEQGAIMILRLLQTVSVPYQFYTF